MINNNYGNYNRITGLASGIDTDSMVKSMTRLEQAKIDRLKQDKDINKLMQDEYRTIMNKLDNFAEKHLNTQKIVEYTESIENNQNNAISFSSISGNQNITIQKVNQLATKETWEGSEIELNKIKSGTVDINAIKTNGLDFSLSIGNSIKDISITTTEATTINNIDDLSTLLNDKISEQFGTDYNNLVTSDGSSISFKKTGTELKIIEDFDNPTSLEALGIDNATSSKDFNVKTIGELFNITDTELSNITINGNTINDLSANDSLDTFINKMNQGNGINIKYDEFNSKFMLEASESGTSNSIDLNTDAINLLSKIGIDDSGKTEAQNLKMTINNKDVFFASNTVNLDGTVLNVNNTYDGTLGEIKATSKVDSQKTLENTKEFIEDYNELVSYIKGKTSERPTGYKPLTDKQKEAMSDREIELWEEQTKIGMLHNDRILNNIVLDLKEAVIYNGELASLGIQSSSLRGHYNELTVDDDKFVELIETNVSEAERIFARSEAEDELQQEMFMDEFHQKNFLDKVRDIKEELNRERINEYGVRGALVEKAGKLNHYTSFNNSINTQNQRIQVQIDRMNEKLSEKEEFYYKQFAQMEEALSLMNSQSAWIANNLGSMLGGF